MSTDQDLLDEFGLSYVIERIPLDKIHPQSFRRNVRKVEINFDIREQYRLAMFKGDEFPRIAGRWMNKLFFVDSGLHRTSAAQELGLSHIEACVGEWSDRTAAEIQRVANARHGLGLTRSERVHQAIELYRHFDLTIARAADLLRVNAASVSEELTRQEGTRRAAAMGLQGFERFQVTTQKYIARTEQDVPFQEIFRIAQARKLPVETVGMLVKAANNARSDEEAVTAIQEALAEPPARSDPAYSTRKSHRPSASWMARTKILVGDVDSLDDARFRKEVVKLSDEDREELRTRLLKVATKLTSWADAAA